MYCIYLGNSKTLCDLCRGILKSVAAVFSVYCFTQKPCILATLCMCCFAITQLNTHNPLLCQNLGSNSKQKHAQHFSAGIRDRALVLWLLYRSSEISAHLKPKSIHTYIIYHHCVTSDAVIVNCRL